MFALLVSVFYLAIPRTHFFCPHNSTLHGFFRMNGADCSARLTSRAQSRDSQTNNIDIESSKYICYMPSGGKTRLLTHYMRSRSWHCCVCFCMWVCRRISLAHMFARGKHGPLRNNKCGGFAQEICCTIFPTLFEPHVCVILSECNVTAEYSFRKRSVYSTIHTQFDKYYARI